MTHRGGGAWAVTVSLLLAACGGETPPLAAPRPRHERFAIFRDLVLVVRPDSRGGPYFLDRFEVSRRDFAEWLHACAPAVEAHARTAEPDDGEPAALRPAARVDLPTARAYAAWRFCRLPTYEEWEYAASAGGAYRYPWGDHARAEWANTPELGLGQPAAIGTFESGRALGGPYDLVGNVAEWTETLSPAAVRDLAASPGAWLVQGFVPARQPAPTLALVAAARRPAARLVAGGAYFGVADVSQPRDFRVRGTPLLACASMEWSDTIGIRLAADPRSLLVALLRETRVPSEPALALLRAFLREPAHRAVLAPEFAAARARSDGGPLLETMIDVLGT